LTAQPGVEPDLNTPKEEKEEGRKKFFDERKD